MVSPEVEPFARLAFLLVTVVELFVRVASPSTLIIKRLVASATKLPRALLALLRVRSTLRVAE